MTYSIDFRKKVLAIKEKEKMSFESISERFGVGKNTVFVWTKKISPLKNRNRASTINSWVEQDLIPKLPNNSVVVTDNASFHKSPHLKTMIEKAGHILEYLPPYSPDLNPIEPKWAQAKSRRRKYRCDVDTLFEKYML